MQVKEICSQISAESKIKKQNKNKNEEGGKTHTNKNPKKQDMKKLGNSFSNVLPPFFCLPHTSEAQLELVTPPPFFWGGEGGFPLLRHVFVHLQAEHRESRKLEIKAPALLRSEHISSGI